MISANLPDEVIMRLARKKVAPDPCIAISGDGQGQPSAAQEEGVPRFSQVIMGYIMV